jgi:biotin carboxylase
MYDTRVLVIGTTPDYVAHIHERYPSRALFITDFNQRVSRNESRPNDAWEVLCELSKTDEVFAALSDHLHRWRQTPSGVACYDCEWLGLAARIALHYHLLFPSTESVRLCRNKHLSKRKWAECGLRCPRSKLVHTGWQAIRFLERLGCSIVLKPLSGTGSELTFRCDDSYDVARAFQAIKAGLIQRQQSPLYQTDVGSDRPLDPRDAILAEEFVVGREYSCDFVIDGSRTILVRVAKKLRAPELPFGTTLAYVVPARLPEWLGHRFLQERLREAALALGLKRAVCMVDFIISQEEIVFLELTPRIGGDCLPPLIHRSSGMDTLGLALDFAEGRRPNIPPRSQWHQFVGLRLFATRAGTIKGVDLTSLSTDRRVKEIFIKRSPGHHIALPPEDYDSWLLGHVIFEPAANECLVDQCKDLRSKLVVDVEPYHDQKFAWLHTASRRTAQPADTAA